MPDARRGPAPRGRGAPVAIVLGGTNPHVKLIENLKARGYRTLLVDYLQSPPARSAADEHVRISTRAMDDVLALARERRASLVISTCVDHANVTAAYVAEKLGLPAPYDFATADLIANKLRMKEMLVSLGIPTADFRAVRSPEEAANVDLPFPVVVKPIDTGGSKGVRMATGIDELKDAVREAFRVSQASLVLVESLLQGVEVSGDCFVVDGETQVLYLQAMHGWRGSSGEVLASYMSISPPKISSAAAARIGRVATEIACGFNLRTTALLLQVMVSGDQVHVIEFAPRSGGALTFREAPILSGVDVIDAAINSFLGYPVAVVPKPSRQLLCSHHVYAKPGRFGAVRHTGSLLESGVIDEFYVHKATGTVIGPSMASAERVASFLVSAGSEQELLRKAHEAMQRLDIVDVHGRSILRRDVCLDFH